MTTTGISTPDPDPGPVDRARSTDLASAGLPGWCAGIVLAADGEERFGLLKYSLR